jgi:amidase
MYSSVGPLLEKYDVFICPTNALPAVKADFSLRNDPVVINGKASTMPNMMAWCMTTPFNTLSRCPVISVPTGHAANRVPTGMQVVGRTYSDARVMRAAMAYEAAVGGWYGEPGRRPVLS